MPITKIAYVAYPSGSFSAHPGGPAEGPSVQIIELWIDKRKKDIHMLPDDVIEAAEALAMSVERSKEEEPR